MPTLRQAAELLAAADSIERLEPIAMLIGCGPSEPLDEATRDALGLTGLVRDARIASGPGAIRALLLTADDDRSLREMIPAAAARLSRRAPHVLWIVVATQPRRGETAIAAWSIERHPPKVCALVADRARVADSDADTLRSLAAAAEGSRDLLVHARWIDVLGREALGARFYRGLDSAVRGLARSSTYGSDAVRDELALLHASRLLFLCFLEAKGWLDGRRDFLAHSLERCVATGGGFQARVLRPLFFGTLNTPARRRSRAALAFGSIPFLNGGLFARTPAERRAAAVVFDDDAYGALVLDLFGQYRFTAAEESVSWTEAAVDPEMLGRVFESLMAARERRSTGAFFTPFALVERVSSFALDDAFAAADPSALRRLILLDPACGSGAFLVHALERIAARLIDLGDERDPGTVRRDVLSRSVFGVDINPTAVWLCQLRLWLSVVIESDAEDPSTVAPLPNLDRNIRVGDALAPGAGGAPLAAPSGGAVSRLRARYVRATGPRKRSLGRELDRAERALVVASLGRRLDAISAARRDLVSARRGRDLFGDRYRPSRGESNAARELRRNAASLRALRRRILLGGALPFSFDTHFAGATARGGFDVIVGNPPWVRLHNIAPEQRAAMKREFAVARSASWEAGAVSAGAGAGFGAQVDLAALFVERCASLLASGGTAALLVPAKLWRSLAGGGVRRLLHERTALRRVEDHSEAPTAFDAAVYPSLVVFSRDDSASRSGCVDVAAHHRGHSPYLWRTPTRALPLDDSPGAPWMLLPPDARRAFEVLRDAGVPLAASAIGRPLLGVKCGCNDAFVVEIVDEYADATLVRSRDGHVAEIERALVRPLLRGEQLRRWTVPPDRTAIIWTHDAGGAPLLKLPPLAARWFRRWRRALVSRADARHSARWWSVYRVDAAAHDRPRVVWCDVGREPRASVLEAGDPRAPLNSCYAVRCPDSRDAHALAALLNSTIARAWLDAVAEPARGGYRRYLGWTLSILPIPVDWAAARNRLAALGRRAAEGSPPSDVELAEAAAHAYGVDAGELAPLVAWMAP